MASPAVCLIGADADQVLAVSSTGHVGGVCGFRRWLRCWVVAGDRLIDRVTLRVLARVQVERDLRSEPTRP